MSVYQRLEEMTPKKAKTIQTKKSPKLKKLPGDSQYATSASILMDAHYMRLGIKKRWNKERVDRLCGFLRMNYGEMASLLHMPHAGSFKEIISSTKPLDGPLCLLLTIIEHKYFQTTRRTR